MPSENKYGKFLERLKDIEQVYKIREELAKEVEAGHLKEEESKEVLAKWRKHRKQFAARSRIDRIVQMDGTVEDKVVDELVKKRLLNPGQAKTAVKKWQTRDKRRLHRQEEKQKTKFCYQCRKNGHLVADCPGEQAENGGATTEGAAGICFKCGSGEHSINKCPRKHVKGFPFATCFVCNQQGHLSKECEQNPNGIYPNGGSCAVCGSQKHLKRDCPELAAQKKTTEEKKIVIHAMTDMTRPDEDIDNFEAPIETQPKKKKPKVVKF